jgi:predicted DNA repair protein MutK
MFGKNASRPDVAAARDAITIHGTMGIGKAVDDLDKILLPDEQCVAMTVADEGTVAICVLTDRRLLVVAHHTGKQAQREVPLDQISSLAYNQKPGLSRVGELALSTAGGSVVVTGIHGAEGQRILPLIRAQIEVARSRQRNGGQTAPDLVGQISQLASLRDQGVLSAAEFDAKKAELLARI